MPFTVAHTITAIPLRRLVGRRAVPSALVIGAMVPDFRHLVPRFDSLGTHTLASLLWFTLPVGLATYLLYDAVLREPALTLLPLAIRRRMGRFIRPPETGPRPSLVLVALCLVIGALTHLAWDELTHRETFVVEHFQRFFCVTLWHRGRHYLYVYRVIQYGSSVAGLVVLAAWCRRWLARQPVDESIGPGGTAVERALGVALVLGLPVIAVLVELVVALRAGQWIGLAAGYSVKIAMRSFAVGVLAFALVSHVRRRRVAA
ncbi:MAG TPA: DUF4184 family protein [Polyangia bacterium]|jgi:hypothetical protein|nr:DUF4184 family protein [Polyangia bacterium]